MLIFDEELVEKASFLQKRAGQLFSKGRFLSAQLEGYLTDDAWRTSASNANAAATRLSEGLVALGAEMVHPVSANLLFILLPAAIDDALKAAGHSFGASPAGAGMVRSRICCNWRTSAEDVEVFLATAAEAVVAEQSAGDGLKASL